MTPPGSVTVRVDPVLLARLDAIAAAWGLSRAASVRRLVELADVEGLAPVGVPEMDELLAIASTKARAGHMGAVSFLAARQPQGRDAELGRLLWRAWAGAELRAALGGERRAPTCAPCAPSVRRPRPASSSSSPARCSSVPTTSCASSPPPPASAPGTGAGPGSG